MTSDTPTAISPSIALDTLLAGNSRFVSGAAPHRRRTVERRIEVAEGQQPLAAVLTCSDSRVAPELVFDQGLGDLYVVRVAGNIASPIVLGSLEFAVAALSVPLIVVLGHGRCAAVAATLASMRPEAVLPEPLPAAWRSGWLAEGTDAPGQIGALVAAIRPALESMPETSPDEALTHAIDANIRYVVGQLQQTPLIASRVAAGALAVVGARYNMQSGQIELSANLTQA